MTVTSIKGDISCQHRDLRSASVPYKREKNHDDKRFVDSRLNSSAQVHSSFAMMTKEFNNEVEGIQSRIRPKKPWNYSSKLSKMAKQGGSANKLNSRQTCRSKSDLDCSEVSNLGLSSSLLDLFPCRYDKDPSNIHMRSLDLAMSDSLHSIDNESPNSRTKERTVQLDKLVEIAEKNWEIKMTDRMIEGEYEVLDIDGENVKLTKKGKNVSKNSMESKGLDPRNTLDDDGFELI